MISENRKITSQYKNINQGQKLSDGLRSPGLLAQRPMLGILMFILGTLIFGGLYYNLVNQGPLLVWDKALSTALPAIGLSSPVYIKYIMEAGFYLGKQVIMVIDALLVIYFLYKRFWQELVTVTVGWGGAALVFYILSTLINRQRPPDQIWIIVNIPGFPSGHAISVVVCYGLLAYWFVPKMPTRFWKGVVVFAALLLILFVGFSRIFTGGHYLTDILSGYAVGLAWSGLAYTAVELFFNKKKAQAVKKE